MDTSEAVVVLTEAAVKRVTEVLASKGDPNLMLRVSVRGGGCSGLSYGLSFDSQLGPHDTVCEFNGVKVVVDAKSALFLYGTRLDFSSELVGGGFKFINPNAKQSCGCGESFSA